VPLTEEAVVFGASRSLAGIVSHPAEFDPVRPAVLLLNSGLTHRAGPYRLYVKLARKLASLGFLVLRFDFSGIGDSGLRNDGVPQNRAHPLETREAMDYVEAAWGTRTFILMGVCRGAWVSFATARQDSRVTALVLINPDTLADNRQSPISTHLKTTSFVAAAVGRGSTWRRVLRGPLHYRAQFSLLFSYLRSPLKHRARSAEADRVAARLGALISGGATVLLIMSEDDPSHDYMAAVLERSRGLAKQVTIETIRERDHIFMSLSSQRSLLAHVETWLLQFICAGTAAPTAGDRAGN